MFHSLPEHALDRRVVGRQIPVGYIQRIAQKRPNFAYPCSSSYGSWIITWPEIAVKIPAILLKLPDFCIVPHKPQCVSRPSAILIGQHQRTLPTASQWDRERIPLRHGQIYLAGCDRRFLVQPRASTRCHAESLAAA
jgi:hypothetical protein